MSHDLGTVTIFRISGLGLSFGVAKGLGLGLKCKKIQNYKSFIVTLPKT